MLRDVGVPMPERRLDEYSWQLSGGLRQRAIIAMALCCNPRLLIADEPTTAVDVTTQAQVLRLLRELQRERNSAIIFITHDLGVIAQMASFVMVMYLGLVMEQGPVDAIFHAPKHPYTQALLRSIPSVSSQPRVSLPTISGSIPHPFNKPTGCPFHPRCVKRMPGRCDEGTPALQAVGETAAGELLSLSRCRGLRMTSPRSTPLLEVRNLRKYFPIQKGFFKKTIGNVRAVDDVSFFVEEGETLGLVGESGCGKTTTSRCVVRALAPSSGEMLFRTGEGQVVDLAKLDRAALRPLRPQMQMIFQDPYGSLNPRMNLFEIVGEPLLVNGLATASSAPTRWRSCCSWWACAPSTCSASHTPSAAASASVSASRARCPSTRAWSWRTSRSPPWTCRCRRRS